MYLLLQIGQRIIKLRRALGEALLHNLTTSIDKNVLNIRQSKLGILSNYLVLVQRLHK